MRTVGILIVRARAARLHAARALRSARARVPQTRAPAGAPLLDEAPAPERALSDESVTCTLAWAATAAARFPSAGRRSGVSTAPTR